MFVDEVVIVQELVHDAILAEMIQAVVPSPVAQLEAPMRFAQQALQGRREGPRRRHVDRVAAWTDDPLEDWMLVHQAGKSTGGRLDEGDRHHLSEAAQCEHIGHAIELGHPFAGKSNQESDAVSERLAAALNQLVRVWLPPTRNDDPDRKFGFHPQ